MRAGGDRMKQVTMEEFHEKIQSGETMNILDVRPKERYDEGHVPGAKHFPLSKIDDNLDQINKSETYYMICQQGKGSYKATQILTEKGYDAINVEKGTKDYPGELVSE